MQRRFSAGDQVPELPASFLNTLWEMAARYRSENRIAPAKDDSATAMSGDFVRVRNTTGATRSANAIVGLGELVLDLDDEAEMQQLRNGGVLFAAEAPAFATHFGQFAVLCQTLPANSVGWARIRGYLLCQIDFAYEDQPFADVFSVAPDFAKLKGGEFGAARVVRKESGTGAKWALVKLRAFDPWLPDVHVYLNEDLDADPYAEATVLRMQSDGSYHDTGRIVDVWGNYLDDDTKFSAGANLWAKPQLTSGLLEVQQSRGCAERV